MPASICDKVIDYLVRNRVSTTEVADALGKTGVVPDLMPINRGYYKAGKIKWVYAYDESNWPVHEQIQELEEDNIVFVDTFNCGNRAIFGELVSKYILLYRQSRAIVINGNMRDAAALIRENWPIWCKGLNPVGCFNRKPDKPFNEERRKKQYGCDGLCYGGMNDDGVMCQPCGGIDTCEETRYIEAFATWGAALVSFQSLRPVGTFTFSGIQ